MYDKNTHPQVYEELELMESRTAGGQQKRDEAEEDIRRKAEWKL